MSLYLCLLSLMMLLAKPVLTIQIDNIEVSAGTIRICLCDDASRFLSGCSYELNVPARAPRTEASIYDLPPGNYCISLYHDVDDDGALARDGLFGLPSEPYGFSNNPRTWFGPPTYERCAFSVQRDTTVLVGL